jgi:hypothetical protein
MALFCRYFDFSVLPEKFLNLDIERFLPGPFQFIPIICKTRGCPGVNCSPSVGIVRLRTKGHGACLFAAALMTVARDRSVYLRPARPRGTRTFPLFDNVQKGFLGLDLYRGGRDVKLIIMPHLVPRSRTVELFHYFPYVLMVL